MSTDVIQKKILLDAPRERVWDAISDARQFGSWFGVNFDGPFAAGARLSGTITPTTVDAEVARMQAPYAGLAFSCLVDRLEPMRLFSFRWHPYAVDTGADYSKEPMTQVTFELEPAPTGVLLTITESGFSGLPPPRRAKAFEANAGGWAIQTQLIRKYLAL